MNISASFLRTTGIILFLAFLECIWLAPYLFTPYLIGDCGDARFNMFIMEHIYQFILGNHTFTDVGIFYPTTNTISYSDMNLVSGLLHSVLRAFGLNMYLAAHYTWILMHFAGSVILFFFLNRKLKVQPIYALIAVITFSFSNAYMIQLNRPQVLILSLFPLCLWFIFNFFESLQVPRKRILYALLSLTTLALIPYTSWYIACYIALGGVLFGLLFCILSFKNIRWTSMRALLHHKLEIAGYFLFSILLLMPYIFITLPSYVLFDRNYISRNLPSFVDLIDVSPDNFLYGSFLENFIDYAHRPGLVCGFAFLTFFLILASVIGQLYAFYRIQKPRLENYLKATLALFCLVWFLLIFKYTNTAYNPWNILQQILPPLGTLRFEQRLLFFISLPTSILIALSVRDFCAYKKWSQTTCFLLALSLAFYLFVENYKPTRNHDLYAGVTEWNLPTQLAKENIPAPPPDCRVMYAVGISPLDTWRTAIQFSLKTTSGYSGGAPRYWEHLKLGNTGIDLHPRMSEYIMHYDLHNICYYDAVKRVWDMIPERLCLPPQ